MSISCIRLSIDSASMLTTLINQFDLSLGSALKCYNPILMPSANRSTIRDLFMKVKRPDTVYATLAVITIILMTFIFTSNDPILSLLTLMK